MRVTKGVIAAAGRGTRFLPVTKAYPKELLAILEKPNIQYLVEELIGAGIKEIAIVHRHGDSAIEKYFTPDKELEKFVKNSGKEKNLQGLKNIWKSVKTLTFIPQPQSLPYGNASPVLASESFTNKEPFVFIFGDDLVLEKKPGNYMRKLIEIYEKYSPAVILGCQKVPKSEIDRYASIKYKKDKNIPNRAVEILEKLPASSAPSTIAQFGRFVLSPKVFSVLEKQKLGQGGELWLSDANNYLAKSDIAIAEPIKNGKWITTGDPIRWLKTNIEFLLAGDKELAEELRGFMRNTLKKK